MDSGLQPPQVAVQGGRWRPAGLTGYVHGGRVGHGQTRAVSRLVGRSVEGRQLTGGWGREVWLIILV